jgi:hypothetical protein
MRYFAVSLSILLAGGAAPQACFAPDREIAAYRDRVVSSADGIKYAELTDAERKNYLHMLNSIPPYTAMMYEEIGFFSIDGSDVVLVVHVERGCVWSDGVMRRATFDRVSQRGGT